jgi:hypothetical protein
MPLRRCAVAIAAPAAVWMRLPGLVAIAIMLLVGCSSSTGSVLNTGGPGTADAEIDANPGQAVDFAVTVLNQGDLAVTLTGIAVIPVRGFQVPRLEHSAVLAEHHTLPTALLGWPIRDPAGQGFYKVLPLHGYVILPWRRRQHLGPLPDMVVVSFETSEHRNAVDAVGGIRVTYTSRGMTYSQSLYSGGEICVLGISLSRSPQRLIDSQYSRYCAKSVALATRRVDQLGGG